MEMALVVSLLLMVTTSVAEIGRYMAVWHGTNAAVRQGADYAAAAGAGYEASSHTDCSEIKWAAVSSSGLAEFGPTDVAVTYEDASGQEIHTCTDANLDPEVDVLPEGSQVVVSIVREVDPLTPPLNSLIGRVTITARDSTPVLGE